MADEERPVVVYLGPEGSYTHQAALSTFPTNSVTLSPQTNISDVFSAVQSRLAHRGVVPFENSSNGSVVFTLDLFADLQSKHPDILVCGEAYVEVRHCLLGYTANQPSSAPPPSSSSPARTQNTPASPPTTTTAAAAQDAPEPGNPLPNLSHIKTLYSHPQAWGQCTNFLATHLPHAERHDVSSTSRAAQIVAEQHRSHPEANSSTSTSTSAALSSSIAADLFGLDILANTINDRIGNTTRFLVLRHRDAPAPRRLADPTGAPASDEPTGQPASPSPPRYKSLLTFTPDNDAHPGALAACLSAFSAQGVNLTSINTRPSGVRNWNYVFFVELQGRLVEEEGELVEGVGAAVNKALEELGKVCKGYRWLGSWVDKTPLVSGG